MTTRTLKRPSAVLRRAGAFVLAVAVLALAGLVWFIHLLPDAIADQESVTDAIVVLTGGSLRVDAGLQLLAAGKARKLFVSGVHPGVPLSDILRASAPAPADVPCCIVLGHAAESTRGNALETAAFMREQDFHSLRLVTSSYHMPRSLLEFERAMPGIRIVANPVFPEIVRGPFWWLRPPGLTLVAAESVKYAAALLGLHPPGAS
jgi:uncharacterized SAM-binding protein YcdF (DUF218 family)